MLRPGDAAPDFVLKDADGRDVRLSTLGGPMVLYFYPRDDTMGCTLQAKGFRDNFPEIVKRGAKVVGISMDRPERHAAFRDSHGLPFHLLSDPEGRVIDLYEAWRTTLLGRHPIAVRRCTFVIDEDGIIRRVHSNVNPLRHAKQVLKDLERLEAQASWGRGEPPTLDLRNHRRQRKRRERPPQP